MTRPNGSMVHTTYCQWIHILPNPNPFILNNVHVCQFPLLFGSNKVPVKSSSSRHSPLLDMPRILASVPLTLVDWERETA